MSERKKLIKLRKKEKLTQQNMSKLLGIARSTYVGYEKGYFNPPIDTAIKIKKILKYDGDDIFLI